MGAGRLTDANLRMWTPQSGCGQGSFSGADLVPAGFSCLVEAGARVCDTDRGRETW